MVNSDKYNRFQKQRLLKRLEAETMIEDSVSSSSGMMQKLKELIKQNRKKIWFLSLVLLMMAFVINALSSKNYSKYSDFNYIGTLMSQSEVLGAEDLIEVEEISHRSVCSGVDQLSDLSAASYKVVYADNFQIAVEKNTQQKVAFASIVKLLGAMVALDHYNFSDKIKLKSEVDTMWNGLDLVVGEGASVKDLLGASLVGSRNDAMYTLAQNYPGGTDAFVEAMNSKAKMIGMANTKVKNPVGYDDDEQYSTANDLAILAIYAMRNPTIASFVKLGYYKVTTTNERVVDVWSTNILLGDVDGVVGLKTGYTEEAGECLITYIEGQRDFAVIILNSQDRMEESKTLINWVKDNCK